MAESVEPQTLEEGKGRAQAKGQCKLRQQIVFVS